MQATFRAVQARGLLDYRTVNTVPTVPYLSYCTSWGPLFVTPFQSIDVIGYGLGFWDGMVVTVRTSRLVSATTTTTNTSRGGLASFGRPELLDAQARSAVPNLQCV